MSNQIPTTVVTGYLGSGKTTIILNLIKQLDPAYKVVWLKNEYGNMSIDSELARENNIEVKEMLNGCLCCVLIGRLKNALEEIIADYHPDRIIIESSGTAFPLPIVFEIKSLPELALDSVINVVDAVNFPGYKYKDHTARLQADCTDLIIINKADQVDSQRLDQVMDEVFELNPNTPKLQTANGNLSKELLLGVDSKLAANFADLATSSPQEHHHEHQDDVETIEYIIDATFDHHKVQAYLTGLPSRDFIRIKGVLHTHEGVKLVNGVYGKIVISDLHRYSGQSKIVLMGKQIKSREADVIAGLQGCIVD